MHATESGHAWMPAPQVRLAPTSVPVTVQGPTPRPPTPDCHRLRGSDARCELITENAHEPYWYGWQLILTDTAALGAAIGATLAESKPAALGALGTYMLAPPLLHLGNGQGFLRAGQSLALRALFPALGSLLPLFLAVSNRNRPHNVWSQNDVRIVGGIGIGLGVVGAMVVDSVFSKRDRTITREQWRPSVSFDARSVTFGVSGRM